MIPPDDELIFADESNEEPLIQSPYTWKLLVVDDDEFVHKVTRLVLDEYKYKGAGLEILSAHSAQDARTILQEQRDIAVILLDVVMETSHAGLDLAAWIRNELQNEMVRIILRTGQPGEAPEQEVIFQYDINDYKEKAELTSQKLSTTVTTALRSYQDLCTIERNRIGLARIIKASPTIFKSQTMSEFASSVLSELTTSIGEEDSSILARSSGLAATRQKDGYHIIASTGLFRDKQGVTLDQIDDPQALEIINKAADTKECVFNSNAFARYFKSINGSESIIYVRRSTPIPENDRCLIEIFSANITVAFDNIDLNNALLETQREMLFTLGEVVETRSSETANHVRRVAEYAALMGKWTGMSERNIRRLKLAAPMHDVGKIGIPDAILLKPAKLTTEEFDIMKTHTLIGHDILNKSARPVMKMAARIALEHHERWDGAGYPYGIAGENISIEGRITMITDVFDALGSNRVYKTAWKTEAILQYLQENKGTMFDPNLINLFIDNLESILEIRELFPDDTKQSQLSS
jgi:response regulator RpfG family c-di-GMP phosphodiesterase